MMTNQEQKHSSLLESLETAHQQMTVTHLEIKTVINQMQTLATQIETTFKSLDSLKTAFQEIVDKKQSAEKNNNNVVETLDEMFRQVTNLVNHTKEKLRPSKSEEEIAFAPEITPSSEISPNTEMTAEEQSAAKTINTAVKTSSQPETGQVLDGIQAGKRAAASLDELISDIDATDSVIEKTTETAATAESVKETVAESIAEMTPQRMSEQPEMTSVSLTRTEMETPETSTTPTTQAAFFPSHEAGQEQSTVDPFESQKKELELGHPATAFDEMLARAKAMTGSIAEAEIEEDDVAVDKLLKTVSSSFVAN
jgi:regulator of replication initiation timing